MDEDYDIDRLVEILPRVLPKLIRENDAIKGAILTALSGVVATRDDIQDLMHQMDERFATIQKQMEERFAAVDERFVALQQRMDERFAAVDRRFEAIQLQIHGMDQRLTEMPQTLLQALQSSVFQPWETLLRDELSELRDRLDQLPDNRPVQPDE